MVWASSWASSASPTGVPGWYSPDAKPMSLPTVNARAPRLSAMFAAPVSVCSRTSRKSMPKADSMRPWWAPRSEPGPSRSCTPGTPRSNSPRSEGADARGTVIAGDEPGLVDGEPALALDERWSPSIQLTSGGGAEPHAGHPQLPPPLQPARSSDSRATTAALPAVRWSSSIAESFGSRSCPGAD